MGKFDNILIFSDIDGTYLGDYCRIVPRNEDAIRRFCAEGGTFTIATGRMELNTPAAIPNIRELANFPVLLSNGANIYDFRTGESIHSFFMEPETVMPLLEFAAERYPSVGIRATVPGGFLYPCDHPMLASDSRGNPSIYHKKAIDDWDTARIYKVVFRAESEVLAKMQQELTPLFGNTVEIILSEVEILEAQRKGVSKGSTIELIRSALRERGTPKRIFCIGDYENDLEMLRAADVAACPSNALDSVKAVSDIIVCDCNDGAIADLIEYIERHPELA